MPILTSALTGFFGGMFIKCKTNHLPAKSQCHEWLNLKYNLLFFNLLYMNIFLYQLKRLIYSFKLIEDFTHFLPSGININLTTDINFIGNKQTVHHSNISNEKIIFWEKQTQFWLKSFPCYDQISLNSNIIY